MLFQAHLNENKLMQLNKFYAHHKKKKQSVYKAENSPELFLEGRDVGGPWTGGRIKEFKEITSHVWYQFWEQEMLGIYNKISSASPNSQATNLIHEKAN